MRANHRSGTVLCVFDRFANEEVRACAIATITQFVDPDALPPPSLPDVRALASRVARSIRDTSHSLLAAIQKQPSSNGNGAPPAPSWHALATTDIASLLHADALHGLSSADADRILRSVGPNVLAGVQVRTPIEILADQVFTVPTALLATAAGLSVLLGDLLEAGAIVLVVGSNIAVGYFTESRAEELLDAWGAFRVEWARVLRHGKEITIAAKEVVPGDVLCVRAGDPIVADARIFYANDLSVDESTLTGESEPSEKRVDPIAENATLADRHNMLYAGTVVATGQAKAFVVATGKHTELGAIQRALSHTEERSAPLEKQLGHLGQTVALAALTSSVAVTGLGLLRRRPVTALVRSAVALGVAAIPEGFPAVGTTALALVSQKLYKQGIVIRRLAAAETLGAVSVICADKTGTLTENRMRVAEVYVPVLGLVQVRSALNGHSTVSLIAENGRRITPPELREIGRIAALNADVEIGDEDVVISGSGTERALVEFSMAIGYPVLRRRRGAPRVHEQRRSAERSFMVTVHEHPELGRIELVKGAPEQVIELVDLPPAEKQHLNEINEAMASRGLRVLALAWRRNGKVGTDAPLTLAGLVGMRDPPRHGVRDVLATLSHAGVRTMMLTGDQERTARAIGTELGIRDEDIKSRVTPEAKLDVVRELQEAGAIVAMTGDGVNDGPALKAAHVGIAMGERGTDIARAVADVVLAHDDLQSLASAVREGRRLYDNVRRAIDYLVSTNTSEVLVMLAGGIVGIEPLGPLQLLWINILTDIAPALALALEPPEQDIMHRAPRDPSAQLFGPKDRRRIVRDASQMALVSLASYGVGALLPGATAQRARTMSFATIVTAQLLHARNCRASSTGTTHELTWALGASFALEAAALFVPTLRHVLRTDKLDAKGAAIALFLGTLPTLVRDGVPLAWRMEPVVAERASMSLSKEASGTTNVSEDGQVHLDEPSAHDAWTSASLFEEARR